MSRRVHAFATAAVWIVLSVAVWVVLAYWLGISIVGELPAVDHPSDEPGGGVPLADIAEVASRRSETVAIPDRLGRGETLSSVLSRNGFSAAEIYDIARALSAIMDVRHLRAGDELEILYDGDGGEATTIRLKSLNLGDLRRVELTRSELGWQSLSEEVELTRRTVSLSGTLQGNLFASMSQLGEGAPLTVAFANVFAWDFDFYTQSREGDRFSLVVEKLYSEGKFVGYGDLRAARYLSYFSGERVFSAFLYEDPSGTRDYYNPEGKSMRKAFLRAPLDFERISSRFSYSRLHPIHKRRMPHLGVDYAARTGTPVYSVAAGVVTGRAFTKGGGNTVTVRHAMGYTTKYLHLSRFAKGLGVGRRVEQKEVIGYVGMTGSATGPHLDFRLIHHGKAVNPVTQIFPPGPPVADEFFSDFEERRARLAKQLDSRRREVTLSADDF
ncbi:MAG: M23 family metallopeptidase [Acidobacteriota bacterium]|nr:MAG: M23 family metallopeptidase [Acidobacteriota bacterium]